ncbi:MAG: hypothetical protein IPH75_13110 [bacterium]|nr:hypothetical protein [bacterium]
MKSGLVNNSKLLTIVAILALALIATGQTISAPIVIDTVTNSVAYSDTLHLIHPINLSDCLLLVAIQFVDNDDSTTVVTCGGQVMTRVGAISHATKNPRAEMWILTNPAQGLANILAPIADGEANHAAITAVTISGIDLSQPIDTCITKSGKSTSGSMVVPSDVGDLVFGTVVSLATGEPDPSVGATLLLSAMIENEQFGQLCSKAGAQSVNIGWAFAESKEWVELGISLNHLNEAPVIEPLSPLTINEGEEISFTVTATDVDGSIPTLTTLPLTKEATFHDNGDGTGTFTFVSTQSSLGVYPITFIASDGDLADSLTTTITVVGANVSPVLAPIGAQSVVVGDSLELTVSASDEDATTPQLSTSGVPADASFSDLANGTGIFTFSPTLAQVGSHEVVFIASDGSLADSETVQITVLDTTQLSYVRIEHADGTMLGDTVLTTDDSLSLYCRGYAIDNSPLGDVTVVWSIAGADSVISPPSEPAASVSFDIVNVGTGKVVVTFNSGISDSSGVIASLAGLPARLEISPQSYTTVLNDTLNFSVQAFDQDANATDPGNVTWSIVGQIGEIDSDGILATARPGIGRIIAVSDRSPVADTSGSITVQSLLVQPAALGNTAVHPGDQFQSFLVALVGNYYQQDKTITSLTIRNVSKGEGTLDQVVECLDSIHVYLDRDLNFEVSAWDTLLAAPFSAADTIHTIACSLTIRPGEQILLLVAAGVEIHAHDGDSLDFCLLPSTDIVLSDSTKADGPDTLNSYGRRIVDGMVSRQLRLFGADQDTVAWSDGAVKILTVEVPHNGYAVDTLTTLSVRQAGTATAEDLDSLLVFVDNGDGMWDGGILDQRTAPLTNNGSWWSRSDLRVPLDSHFTRLFLLAHVSRFATRGATLQLGIPQYGIGVASGNDGPLDREIGEVDTVTIMSERELALSAQPIATASVVWGAISTPLLSLELVNHSGVETQIDSFLLTSYTLDLSGATQSQLDEQFDSILVYHNLDGNPLVLSGSDTLIATGVFADGKVMLSSGGLILPAGNSSTLLSIVLAVSGHNARAGTQIGVGVDRPEDIFCSTPIPLSGMFPVTNPQTFSISGFPAACIATTAIEDRDLTSGQENCQVLRFRLPGNGYAADSLQSIRILNQGSLSDANAIRVIRLWSDLSGDGWTPDDQLITELLPQGLEWFAGNLRKAIASGGASFVLTASITSQTFRAGTFAPAIPIGGLVYRSGLNGPDDAVVSGGDPILIMPADRITVVALTESSDQVYPGTSNVPVLAFALYNGYTTNRQLSGLRISNQTRSEGDEQNRDRMLSQLRLYHDRYASGSIDSSSLLASGYFSAGILNLDGFTASLPAESLSYLFVTADVSLETADSDTLAIAALDAADLAFTTAVSLNGDIPLRTGRALVVEGSMAAQYNVLSLPSQTVRPGDTARVLMAFHPAHNGTETDTLLQVSIGTSGSSSDFQAMQLWLDSDHDSIWQATDQPLGALHYSSGLWRSDPLDLSITDSTDLLWVTADIDSAATSGTIIQTWIPINGCTFASANDGPLDVVLTSPAVLTVYASRLQVSQAEIRPAYSVGEIIAVRLQVENHFASTLTNVVSEIALFGDSSAVRFDSSSAPLTLAASAGGELTCYFTAIQPGQVAWRMRAIAPLVPDSSAFLATATTSIQVQPSAAEVGLLNSAPASVTRGQKNVFPLTIRVAHPDSGQFIAPLEVHGVQLVVRDATGVGRTASSVFSRMAFAAGFTNYALSYPVPDDSTVTLTFDTPVIVLPGEEAQLALLVDIDSLSPSTTFVLALDGPGALIVHDANSQIPVAIQSQGGFPLSTALCRVVLPAGYLAVSGATATDRMANLGQEKVSLMEFTLRHPGDVGGSPIQVTSLVARITDSSGNPLIASQVIDQLTLRSLVAEYGTASGAALQSDLVQIDLTSPFTLGPGASRTVSLECQLSPMTDLAGFRLIIPDSICLSVREIGSGATVSAATDTAVLSTSSAFPMTSGWVEINRPAMAPSVCLTSLFAENIVAGTEGVELVEISATYPDCPDCSPVRLSGIRATLLNNAGVPLDPQRYLDRIGASISGQAVWYQPYVELISGDIYFRFGETGCLLAPGDSIAIRLIADIEAMAPFDSLNLIIESEDRIGVQDVADENHEPGISTGITCQVLFPVAIGPATVIQPAGRPSMATEDGAVIVAHRGQTGVTLLDLAIDYGEAGEQGIVELLSVNARLQKRVNSTYLPVGVSQVMSNIGLWLDDSLLMNLPVTGEDSISLALSQPVALVAGDSHQLRLTGDISPSAVLANYSLALRDSLSLGLRDPMLSTTVYPQMPAATYPLRGTEISVTGNSLSESFSNFPNPFIPDQGSGTTIAFSLSEPATVSIGIYSITGDLVTEIAASQFRGAGQYQEDHWSGYTDKGRKVLSGTYFCRLNVTYASGRTESLQRKVAVIR